MHITGERLVPAPRERVWRSLADPAVLRDCVPGARIEPDGEGGLLLSSSATGGGASVRAQPSIRDPFSTMGWRIDPGGAGSQMVLVRLAEQGVFTRLEYEVSLADPEGGNPEFLAGKLRERIDQGLERFSHTVAGPGEIGAGGLGGLVQAVTEPATQPNANILASAPSGSVGQVGVSPGNAQVILGLLNPSVIGGVLFLIVLLFLVGLF